MKKNTFLPLFSIALILVVSGIFLILIQNQNTQISDIQTTSQSEIAELKKQIATLQLIQVRQRVHPTIVNRPSLPPSILSKKDQFFKFLYSINGPASSENAAVAKKIRYLPGQLIIDDLSVAQNDPFFDLLGFLLDENAVKKIEVPHPKLLPQGKRRVVQAIKTELLQFGVSPDLMGEADNDEFQIKINDFKD
jgi:hypothetical protein